MMQWLLGLRRWPAALLLLILWADTAAAQLVAKKPPGKLEKVDVVEHLGDTIPLDLQFVDSGGDTVRLERYFHQGKPVLLTLVYFECPMLCTLVLNGVANTLQKLDWTPGKEFQIVTISIDPGETPEMARQKKYRYLQSLGRTDVPDSGWVFLVGPESQSRRLADALGFRYTYDPKIDNYAHPAVIFLLSDEGVISRYLYGIEFKQRDLRLGLLEASQGKIGNTVDRLLLFCYHYDPLTQGYTLFATNLMRAGGVLTVILLAVFLTVMWKREKRK